jgi:hypothetical protein
MISALLLAVNVFHIFYSQDARSYSLLVLLITCSCLFFAQEVKSQGREGGAWYIVTSVAALYAHFFAALVLLSQFVCWTLLPARLRRWGQFRNMVIVAVLGVPLALFVILQGASGISYHLDWAQTGRRASLAKDIYHLVTNFSGSGLKFALFGLACVLALREWWVQSRHNQRGEEWPFLFVTLWLLVPIFVTLFMSYWKFVFVSRFLIICLPAALLLFGEGLALIRPNWLGFAVVALAIVASLVSVRSYYRQPAPSDWRAAIGYLAQNAHSGDMLIFANPYCRFPFEYNLRFSGKHLPPMQVQYSDPAAFREFPPQTEHIWLTDFSAQGHQHWDTLPARGSGAQSTRQFRLQRTLRFPGVELEQFDPVEQVQGAVKR